MSYKFNIQYLFSYLGLFPFIVIIINKYFLFQIKEETSDNQTAESPDTKISNNEPVWGTDMVKDIVNIFRISTVKNFVGLPTFLKG